MSFVYQIRRDTAANWTAANPTLLQGEWALETDTKLTKLGDGVTAWNSLDYFMEDVPNIFIQNNQPTMVTGDLWLDVSSSV
jgi:hypothetical protein